MNVVTELNELAEKLTGKNPQATIDAEAIKYLKENTNGGGSTGQTIIEVDETFLTRYFSNPSAFGTPILVTNTDDYEKLEKLDEDVTKNNDIDVIYKLNNEGTVWKYRPYVGIVDGKFAGLQVEILQQPSNITYSIIIYKSTFGSVSYYVVPQIYTNTPYSISDQA